MKALGTVRKTIQHMKEQAQGVGKLTKLNVPRRIMTVLRKELGLAPDDEVVIDDVPILELTDREELIQRAVAYALHRWNVRMTPEDVVSLLLAVPTEELLGLIPLVMSQHLDDKGYVDPLEKMDAAGAKEMKEMVEELGFVDASI